jgi:hypothetical protein
VVDEAWLQKFTGETDLEEVGHWTVPYVEALGQQLMRELSDAPPRQVDRLDLKIDTRCVAIDRLGLLLPSLRTLNLVNSKVESIRDLGTSLKHLLTLELSYW